MNAATASVVIPTYNRREKVVRAISSVLAQDYANIEVVVVDDGSTDGTEPAIRALMDAAPQGRRILYLKQNNSGACVARNRGMMHATGHYLMFLDSDDVILQTKIRSQVEQVDRDGTACSICDFECVDDAGSSLGVFRNNRAPLDFISQLKSPSISTVLMRRSSIPPGLQWNDALIRTQDIDFMYKYFASLESWSYLNEPLFQYCLHKGERISDSYTKGIQYRVLRRSFKDYLRMNRAFLATDAASIYRAYKAVLLRHQWRNLLVGLVPGGLRAALKKVRSRHRGTESRS